jgi:hypothetical protein
MDRREKILNTSQASPEDMERCSGGDWEVPRRSRRFRVLHSGQL